MLTPSRFLGGVIAASLLLSTCPVHGQGQRIQFPSTPPATTAPPAGLTAPTITAPPLVPGPAPAPGGTLLPPPTWDPYGQPTATAPPMIAPLQGGAVFQQQPPSLFPGGAPLRPQPGYYGAVLPDGSLAQMRRFLSEIRLEHTWLGGPSGVDKLQMHTSEISGTFAIPFLYNTDSPLLVTPGLALTLLDGPTTALAPPTPDLPPRVYDAYLDLGWKPHLTPWLSGDLGVRASLSSDLRSFNSKSMRWMGRGLGVLTFTPEVQVALGVVYLDRQDIKLLPAGGLIWTPSPDVRYDILFPNPKLAKRLNDIGTLEVWCYAAAEYGGGSWNVNRPISGVNDNFDYNDIRTMLGLEWSTHGGLRGHLEVGYVFARELVFDVAPPAKYSLDNTYMLRGGLSF